ncbi:hypothetical protein AVEN_268109-1 [Araneus ventricosus]|uniref:Uncharacterized protein n=1 Tax=Araneus ventricosus TaxID=182803 RepID=A0A4Y2T5L1_ARAVE|nr:hypothetical protein AVEN_268109-1 [Araneus ventricosus]
MAAVYPRDWQLPIKIESGTKLMGKRVSLLKRCIQGFSRKNPLASLRKKHLGDWHLSANAEVQKAIFGVLPDLDAYFTYGSFDLVHRWKKYFDKHSEHVDK